MSNKIDLAVQKYNEINGLKTQIENLKNTYQGKRLELIDILDGLSKSEHIDYKSAIAKLEIGE